MAGFSYWLQTKQLPSLIMKIFHNSFGLSFSLPADFFDNGVKPAPLKGILKKPQLAGDYDSSSSEDEENGDKERSIAPAPSSGGSMNNSTAATPIGSTNTGTINSTLPSGMCYFFSINVPN